LGICVSIFDKEFSLDANIKHLPISIQHNYKYFVETSGIADYWQRFKYDSGLYNVFFYLHWNIEVENVS